MNFNNKLKSTAKTTIADPLSDDSINALFDKHGGDIDAVLDELRAMKVNIPNSDLQGLVEAIEMSRFINRSKAGLGK